MRTSVPQLRTPERASNRIIRCTLALSCTGYLIGITVLSSCGPVSEADEAFGDQHFKTAVALIELHKVRYGEYPDSLPELRFLGEWDQLALRSVKYRKISGGYELELVRNARGQVELSYPRDFWQGLGLRPSGGRNSIPVTEAWSSPAFVDTWRSDDNRKPGPEDDDPDLRQKPPIESTKTIAPLEHDEENE